MKLNYFLFIVLIFSSFLIVGCTQVTDVKNCQNTCADQNSIREMVSRDLNISNSSFSVVCSECHFGRGGSYKARIETATGKSDIFHHWGWCSSGGTDCGYVIKFNSSDVLLYEKVKGKYCSNLYYTSHNDSICSNFPVYDNSSIARERCFSGSYEDSGMISIVQNSNRCHSEVRLGNFSPLFD